MDFWTIVLVCCFVYIIAWNIASTRIYQAEGNLQIWMLTHPYVWPGNYKRGRELILCCIKAYKASFFFLTPEDPQEKLRELHLLLEPKEITSSRAIFMKII
jgi:hypothetical protein